MIVKDEEAVLARCLEGAKAVTDEIVIVDTGSADRTEAIAKRYTDRVEHFAWQDDFAAARNFAFSLATGDYLLWMDADDVLPPATLHGVPALRALLEREQPDVLCCPYQAGDLVYFRERFLRRTAGLRWVGRVHECIEQRGKVVRCGFLFVHRPEEKPYSSRNLAIYRRWEREEPLSDRDLFYYGRELFYHGFFGEAREKLEAMLGGDGWYVNKIEACKVLAECALSERDEAAARRALLRSFSFGAPRASVLCRLGDLCMQTSPKEAVFWYRAALMADDHTAEGDFERPDCRTVIPLLQLVVCHWKLGEKQAAFVCHKKTEELAPAHPSVVFNRTFFAEQGFTACE